MEWNCTCITYNLQSSVNESAHLYICITKIWKPSLTILLTEKRCTCTFVWDKKCTLWSFNNFVIFLDMADLSFTCTTGYKSCKNICNKSVLHNREYENWEYSRIHQPRSRLIIKYRDFWVEFEHENVYAFCFPFAQTYITLQLFEKKKSF